ncbi:hypothetical protein CRG98_042893 [Punica granatum]|uniref:Uncharacterized protein n=1 Tax=Punica granatum TaxID=22663 RepID=A0A2I0HYL4_PUNGR|nr:hypothetical protein CRG98_042893 [Punica granatum]
MDAASWTQSPKSNKGNAEATTSVREWRGAPERGAWHWVMALLGWADATPNVLICRKPASPLGRLLVALPDAGSIAGAILCQLFDAPIGLEPFSSGYCRAVALVTRMGISVQIWSPRGVFDLANSILLSLELARAKGSKDSTAECIVFCLRRGVAFATPLFVGALLKPNVSCPGTCRYMLSVMGLCSGEGPICPGVLLDLSGDARVEVERYHSPVGDVTVLVTFAAGGQGHALFVGAVACDLLWREGWDSVLKFQGAGREVFIVLIVVVQGSNCPLVSYFLQWEEEKQ